MDLTTIFIEIKFTHKCIKALKRQMDLTFYTIGSTGVGGYKVLGAGVVGSFEGIGYGFLRTRS